MSAQVILRVGEAIGGLLSLISVIDYNFRINEWFKERENNRKLIKEIEDDYVKILGSAPAARQQLGHLIEATSRYPIDILKLANEYRLILMATRKEDRKKSLNAIRNSLVCLNVVNAAKGEREIQIQEDNRVLEKIIREGKIDKAKIFEHFKYRLPEIASIVDNNKELTTKEFFKQIPVALKERNAHKLKEYPGKYEAKKNAEKNSKFLSSFENDGKEYTKYIPPDSYFDVWWRLETLKKRIDKSKGEIKKFEQYCNSAPPSFARYNQLIYTDFKKEKLKEYLEDQERLDYIMENFQDMVFPNPWTLEEDIEPSEEVPQDPVMQDNIIPEDKQEKQLQDTRIKRGNEVNSSIPFSVYEELMKRDDEIEN